MTYMFDGKQYIAVAAGRDHDRAGDPDDAIRRDRAKPAASDRFTFFTETRR